MKNILVLGGTGGIGSHAVELLLQNAEVGEVRIIVRSPGKLPEVVRKNPKLKVVTATSLLDMSASDMAEHLDGIDAMILSLGHDMSLKGVLFSRLVVLDACKLVCDAIVQSGKPMRLIEVNSIGVPKPDGTEIGRGFGTTLILGMIGRIVPPLKGSFRQATYMLKDIGRDNKLIEWVLVRPDRLLDEADVSTYEVHDSIPWSMFKARSTSRINVADLMCKLALDDDLFERWKGQFPVVINQDRTGPKFIDSNV